MRKILIIAIAVALLGGCSRAKRDAFGSFNAVFAFVDSEEADFTKEPLRMAIERTIVTPQHEKLFRIVWGDTSTFEDATKHHIVLIAASLQSSGDFGDYIRRSLSPEVIESVRAGEYSLFVRRDPWARKQLLVIITAPTAEGLQSHILTKMDDLFHILNEFCNENVAEWLFGSYRGQEEKYELEKRIADEYGFFIRVPRMFDWESGTAAERFIWLRALDPERWVFVWWMPIDSVSAGLFSLRLLAHLRDSICDVHYEGDSLQPGTLKYERTSLNGLPAIMYRARWYNSQNLSGGPVVGFVVDDIRNGRRYIIDGAVFAPGARKEPYLRHCEIVIRSFKTQIEDRFASEAQ